MAQILAMRRRERPADVAIVETKKSFFTARCNYQQRLRLKRPKTFGRIAQNDVVRGIHVARVVTPRREAVMRRVLPVVICSIHQPRTSQRNTQKTNHRRRRN
jgi:hypothetical protein